MPCVNQLRSHVLLRIRGFDFWLLDDAFNDAGIE